MFRTPRHQYRRNLPHIQSDNKPHFVTFCTYKRLVLPELARDLVLECCIHDHQQKIDLHVAVVMPDHAHLILTPLIRQSTTYTLAEIMNGIKGASAHRINRALGRRGHLWQEESFDHVLRSSESLDQKIEYVRQNPVRRGLAAKPEEYRWLWP